MLESYRKKAEEEEARTLFQMAAFSRNHQRLNKELDDYRLPYKRDVDRIIHSKAYARYTDKTQVVYLVDNDHITHRALHVQLVSAFARGIAEILGLNLDLVEAIALGHDVGHPPFGHEGELYLSALSKEFSNGPFTHSLQSCRLLSEIEPLNLGLAVYDGFLCHDGGLSESIYRPKFGKTWEDHFQEKEQKKQNPSCNIWPSSLEGCLVKICDTISYTAKDIEDAINLKILSREQIPTTCLGKSNSEILRNLATDLIENSFGKEYIALSDESLSALKILRSFNFQKIYTHPKLKVESQKIKSSYRILFQFLLQDFENQKDNSYLYENYLSNKTSSYINETNPVQKVIDYISGMTDHFFIRTLQTMILPKEIQL